MPAGIAVSGGRSRRINEEETQEWRVEKGREKILSRSSRNADSLRVRATANSCRYSSRPLPFHSLPFHRLNRTFSTCNVEISVDRRKRSRLDGYVLNNATPC